MRHRLACLFAAGLLGLLALISPAQAREIKAGPIWNDMDADRKCPSVCRDDGRRWSGQWRTTKPGRMSVCECSGRDSRSDDRNRKHRDRLSLDTGPIWNNFDAQRKCPNLCSAEPGYKWDGNWRTTQMGRTSQCDCVRK